MSEIGVLRLVPRALAWAGCLIFGWLSVVLVMSDLGFGVDSHAYWSAWQGAMYDAAPATRDAYLYSPAFAQAIWLPAQLPWPAFAAFWVITSTATIAWLAAGAGTRWAVPLVLLGTFEILTGNVNWLLALVAVFGLRYPGLWSIALLTKITPALGPVWFIARGEWRKLTWAVVWTAGATLVSFAIAPELWREWSDFLTTHMSSASGQVGSGFLPPLTIRMPLVVALVFWGARTNRVWVLPVGMALASPVDGIGQLVVLLALPRLRRSEQSDRYDVQAEPVASRLRTWLAPKDASGR